MKEKWKTLLQAIAISGLLHLIIVIYHYFSISSKSIPGEMTDIFDFSQNIVYICIIGSFLIGIVWIHILIDYLKKGREKKV